jgi:hypothetical protein
MKKLTTSILTCGILASGLLSASATAHLRLSPDAGTTWIVIDDNGPLDTDPTVGVVEYDGPIGNWSVSISSGQSEPFIGSPATPNMDLNTINSSTQPASLIVQYCDSGLTTFASETYIDTLSYNTGGTVMQNAYRDSGNVIFGTSQTYSGGAAGTSPSPTALLLSSTGPVSGANSFSNGAVVLASGNFPNSLTIETVIIHNGTGRTSTDAHLRAVPQPPCNCTLTFSGSPTATICAGDTLPAITANQDCGTGPVTVQVTPVSLTTNGVCPQIVTRTFTATDSCGTVYPFTQTITVNCKPDCKISTSVTTAMSGVAGYTASVANAGAGATYDWSILNGTITAGFNTSQITWTAGTDTSSPISIYVTVTAATDCKSSCSASVTLKSGPSGCSFTPGGWGAPPNGGNIAALMYAKFPTLYPKGLTVGGTYYLKFVNASNITDFLPSGGTPGVLKKSYTNPIASTEAGEFASQVMALRLNVDFSNAGYIKPGLASLKIAPGFTLAGTKVSDLLTLVQKVLGGSTASLPAGVSVSDLTFVMSAINGNFDNCTSNNGVLVF